MNLTLAMSGLLNRGGNRGGEQLLCHLGDPPGIFHAWTEDQMIWVLCSMGQAACGEERTLRQEVA